MTRPEGPSTRETSVETETTTTEAVPSEIDEEDDGDDPPTAAEAIAQCAATFDAADTERIPNGTGRWNAYAGSCHRSE